jgi:hypothetical protein
LWPEGSGDRPSWARCFDRRQQELFERCVREYFRDQADAVFERTCVRAEGEQYGLHNVAQVCLPLPEDEWPRRIALHFDGVRKSKPEALAWLERRQDWAWARERLLVRLHGKGALPASAIVARADLPQIDTVLVADLPSMACNVTPHDLTVWGLAAAEVFAAAVAIWRGRNAAPGTAVPSTCRGACAYTRSKARASTWRAMCWSSIAGPGCSAGTARWSRCPTATS